MYRTDITTVYYHVDNFFLNFEKEWQKTLIDSGQRKRHRDLCLSLGEIITIILMFQFSYFQTFKHFYQYLQKNSGKKDFPNLPSYSHFVTLMKSAIIPLSMFLEFHYTSTQGIQFIDSSAIAVCHRKRISSNKVFKGWGKVGKTTMGWFFGFKVHIAVDLNGNLLGFTFTRGNVDDRKPVPELTKNFIGKIFGDKGYISKKLFQSLLKRGLKLITPVKKTMRNQILPDEESLLLKKRSLIESIFNQLKYVFQIEHTRHRSPWNFMVNTLAALSAYVLYENKPSISHHFRTDDINLQHQLLLL